MKVHEHMAKNHLTAQHSESTQVRNNIDGETVFMQVQEDENYNYCLWKTNFNSIILSWETNAKKHRG